MTHTQKVQKSGNSLVVSVPKGWADFYGIEKGDTVYVETNGKMVVHLEDPRETE